MFPAISTSHRRPTTKRTSLLLTTRPRRLRSKPLLTGSPRSGRTLRFCSSTNMYDARIFSRCFPAPRALSTIITTDCTDCRAYTSPCRRLHRRFPVPVGDSIERPPVRSRQGQRAQAGAEAVWRVGGEAAGFCAYHNEHSIGGVLLVQLYINLYPKTDPRSRMHLILPYTDGWLSSHIGRSHVPRRHAVYGANDTSKGVLKAQTHIVIVINPAQVV